MHLSSSRRFERWPHLVENSVMCQPQRDLGWALTQSRAQLENGAKDRNIFHAVCDTVPQAISISRSSPLRAFLCKRLRMHTGELYRQLFTNITNISNAPASETPSFLSPAVFFLFRFPHVVEDDLGTKPTGPDPETRHEPHNLSWTGRLALIFGGMALPRVELPGHFRTSGFTATPSYGHCKVHLPPLQAFSIQPQSRSPGGCFFSLPQACPSHFVGLL